MMWVGTITHYDPATGFARINVQGVEYQVPPGVYLPGAGPAQLRVGLRVNVAWVGGVAGGQVLALVGGLAAADDPA